jgi:uncharacterized phiE125 gp8 family phage protein
MPGIGSGIGPFSLYGTGVLATYGTLTLTASSPVQQFCEVLTLAEVRAYLKLPDRVPPDPAEDDLLNVFIVAAREQAEIYQNRDLVRKQWDLARDYWPDYHLPMRGPLVSVDLVQYRDNNGAYTQMAENVDYIVDASKSPGLITPPYGVTWPAFTPWPTSALLVRFTSGMASSDPWWSDAGARVKIGMKLLISNWFNGRLPFLEGRTYQELPFAVTSCLSQGAVPRGVS